MASNLSNSNAAGPQGQSAIEMSIAPSLMTVAAVACPLHDDGASTDLLYAILPPQYGTGEWLALASLAAKQYQQAEQVWRARAQSEEHAALERRAAARPGRSRCGWCRRTRSCPGWSWRWGSARASGWGAITWTSHG